MADNEHIIHAFGLNQKFVCMNNLKIEILSVETYTPSACLCIGVCVCVNISIEFVCAFVRFDSFYEAFGFFDQLTVSVFVCVYVFTSIIYFEYYLMIMTDWIIQSWFYRACFIKNECFSLQFHIRLLNNIIKIYIARSMLS